MYENVINGFQEKFFVFHRHKFEKRVEYLIANGKNLVHVFNESRLSVKTWRRRSVRAQKA